MWRSAAVFIAVVLALIGALFEFSPAQEAPQHPVLVEAVARNDELRLEQAELESDRIALEAQEENLRSRLDRITTRFDDARERVAAAGMSQSIGILLRKQRGELPSPRVERSRMRERVRDLEAARLRRVELDIERDDLAQPGPIIASLLFRAEPLEPAERASLRADLERVFEQRLALIDALRAEWDRVIEQLVQTNEAHRALVEQGEAFAAFIDEHILWIRSTHPIWSPISYGQWAAAWRFVHPEPWWGIVQAVWGDMRSNAALYALVVLLFIVALRIQHRIRRRLDEIAELVGSISTDHFRLTAEAPGLTALLTIPWPLLVAFLGWRLTIASGVAVGDGFAAAVGAGLWRAALILLTYEAVVQICRRNGLGDAHFPWRERHVRTMRHNARWLIVIAVPTVFVTYTAEATLNAAWIDTLGRASFIVGMLALTWFIRRVLRREGGILEDLLRAYPGGWLDRLKTIWYPLVVASPLALALAAAFGYSYTALQLDRRLIASVWLLLGIIVAHSLLIRWLMVAQRRVALRQVEERRAAALAEREEALRQMRESPDQSPTEASLAPGDESGGLVIEEPKLDLAAVNVQMRTILNSAAIIAGAIGLWLVWVDVLPALAILDRIQLYGYTREVAAVDPDLPATVVTYYVTLGSVVLALLFVLITVIAAKNIPGLLEITLLERLPLEASGRYAATTIARYVIVMVGLVLVVTTIGLRWSDVHWLAAAITVGLGFGLQEIFANFVSGIIILFEQPIRVGDTVTIGNVSGTVTKIRMRATTIVDWDRKELIVPNKEFITSQLVNWTLSDRMQRITLEIGIAYGSDTALAERTLLRIADENPLILKDPAPSVVFREFADSALEFHLRIFVADLQNLVAVRHQMNMAIDHAFREHGIEIAFPQRDIHIRTAEGLDRLMGSDVRGQSSSGQSGSRDD